MSDDQREQRKRLIAELQALIQLRSNQVELLQEQIRAGQAVDESIRASYTALEADDFESADNHLAKARAALAAK
jgi:hypothetical protein